MKVVQQVPSVGRIVMYYAYGTPGGEYPVGEARAAVITTVHRPNDPDSPVGLCVLNPTGMFFNQYITKARQTGHAGCWDWPPYVAPIEVEVEG